MLSMCLLVVPLVAQAPKIDDLLSKDWRVRNDAARALASLSSEQIDINGLLRVMRTDWQGGLPLFGLFGGRGGRMPRVEEPRERINLEISSAMMATGQWWHQALGRITVVTELRGPWEPRTLAAWLLEQHATAGSRRKLQLTLDDERVARVWLLLAAPPKEKVRRLLADETVGRHVAQALEQLGRDDVLCDALAAGDSVTRRNVLAVGGGRLLKRDDCLVAAVDLVLHDDDHEAVQHAALLVEQSGARGLAALTKALRALDGGGRAVLRGFAVLCGSKDGSVAHALALDHVDDVERDVRHRALYLLGRHRVAAALQVDAATRLLKIIEGDVDRDARLLALDALGQCGAGVSAKQRQRLIAMLVEPPVREVRARVLGCLRMLGVANGVPPKTLRHVAAASFPTTATWLALADRGAPAADVLAKLFGRSVRGVDKQAVANRLAETAPEVLRTWLFGYVPRLQPIALNALRSIEPDSGVTTADLLGLLTNARRANNEIIGYLVDRDDVGEAATQVFAWMAAHGDGWQHDSWLEFVEKNPLPTPRMIELMGPQLQQGHNWAMLLSGDRAIARAACRKWFARAADDSTRARLAGALCQLGIEDDDDTQIVLTALNSDYWDKVLHRFVRAQPLPRAVLARVEELFESAQGYARSEVVRVLRSVDPRK